MRFVRIGWFLLQVMVGAVVHLVATILFVFCLPGFHYWYSLGVFSVGWFVFFTFSTAIYVSISARILRTLDQCPGRTMTVEEIFDVSVKRPFEERADFFVKTGMVTLDNGKYQITKKGCDSASRILQMRKILGMDGSGLYRQ
jgi:energy-coupling factor transporter transmembrane protein EcfT